MRKTKITVIKICVSFVVFCIVFLSVKGIIAKLEPTSMIEIPDTRMHYDNDDMGVANVERYIMVINPPKKNIELKRLILDYCKKNKKKIEDMNGYKTKRKMNHYFIAFYKEGKGFSRKWNPNLESDTSVTEQLMEHNENSLGYVEYNSEGTDNINIYIWERAGDGGEDKKYTVPMSFFDE